MTLPQVQVLCHGMIRREGKAVLEAHSSSTLVVCPDLKIVVDTSSPQYRQKVLGGLKERGIDPRQISLVINTHSHHDHISNNDLFPYAELLVYEREQTAEIEIRPGVTIVPTPGHTRGSVSLFVVSDRRYAIVGDAIPTQDNYLRWLPPGLNYDPEEALRSMRRIVDFAEVIIPGHSAPFETKQA
jgi:N-acyl homoserine lactone hydrolase